MSANTGIVLILTETAISTSHGTGTCLLRHFETFPRARLIHAFSQGAPDDSISQRIQVKEKIHRLGWRVTPRAVDKLYRRIRWFTPITGVQSSWDFEPIAPSLAALGLRPDVIYSNVYTRRGLRLLKQLCIELGAESPKLPVIQHFHDLQIDSRYGFDQALRALRPHLAETWALTDAIKDFIGHKAGAPALKVDSICAKPKDTFKTRHNPFSKEFRMVIVGNFWDHSLVGHVGLLYRMLKEKLPDLSRIEWFASAASLAGVRKACPDAETFLDHRGFLSADLLHETLINADLLLIPFNLSIKPDSDYARYSFPSRLSEIFWAGAPAFFIGGRETETGRVLETNGLGFVPRDLSPATVAAAMLEVIHDTEKRRAAGFASRQWAEKHMNLNTYAEFLMKHLGIAHE